MFKARTIKSIIVVMGITLLSGCNTEVMNCLASTQASSCLELTAQAKDSSFNTSFTGKIDQGGSPTSGGKIDQGGSPSNGGKIDQGGSPSNGGKIDQGGAPTSGGKIATNNTYSSGSKRSSTQHY